MPKLKNAKHEKLARIYAEEAVKNDGIVVKADVYTRVYKKAAKHSAQSNASRLMATPEFKTRLEEIIGKRNCDEDISRDLEELRKATKDVVMADGRIIEVRDNGTRLGAVQTVLKVRRAFNQEQAPAQDNRQVVFNMTGDPSSQASVNDGAKAFLTSMSNIVDKLGILNARLGTAP